MKVPTKDDWEQLRLAVTEWYRTQTAELTVKRLGDDGYHVSQKMLRDRCVGGAACMSRVAID